MHTPSGTRFFPGYKAVVTYKDPQRVGHSRDVVCEILKQASTGRPVFVISMPADEDGEAVSVSSHSATSCLNAFILRVLGRDSSKRSGLAFFGLTRAAIQRDLRELDKENAEPNEDLENAEANEGRWHLCYKFVYNVRSVTVLKTPIKGKKKERKKQHHITHQS